MIGLTPENFNKVALGVSGIVTAFGLVVGGVFTFIKYVDFEEKTLAIELLKAEAGINQQVDLEARTTIYPNKNTINDYIVEQYGCIGEAEAPASCALALSSIAERDKDVSKCRDSQQEALLPQETRWMTVSHSLPFQNFSGTRAVVSVEGLTVYDAGDLKLAPTRDSNEILPSNMTLIAKISDLSSYFLGTTSAIIGAGYEKNFGGLYRIPVQFGCGSISKTIVFAINVGVKTEQSEADASSIQLVNVCVIDRSITPKEFDEQVSEPSLDQSCDVQGQVIFHGVNAL